MPQFFLQQCGAASDGKLTAVATCNTQAIVAAAREPNVVAFYNDQGAVVALRLPDLARSEEKCNHKGAVTMLSWSPDGTRLVTGDANGIAVLWKVDGASGRAVPAHTYRRAGAVTECVFLSYPSLAGGGSGGAAAKPAAAPAPAPALGADINTPHGLLIATVPPPAPGTAAFIFGGDAGVLTFGNENGFVIDVLTNLHSAVDVLEYTPETGRIAVVSRSLLMTQLHFSPADGKIASAVRAKMAIKGTAGIRQRAWVGGGVLATASPDEPVVRCWDWGRDENYQIASAANAAGSIPRHERLAAMAFSPAKGLLAVGSETGYLYVWRRFTAPAAPAPKKIGGDGGAGAAAAAAVGAGSGSALASASGGADAAGASPVSRDAWEPVFATSFPAGIVALDFSARTGLLAVRLASQELHTVTEATTRRKLVGNLSVVQLNAREVAVERRGPPNSKDMQCPGGALTRAPVAVCTIRAGLPIRGVDATENHVLVWGGRGCEVYSVAEFSAATPDVPAAGAAGAESGSDADGPGRSRMLLLPAPRLVGGFATTAQEMAICGDTVYAGVGDGNSSSFGAAMAAAQAAKAAVAAAAAATAAGGPAPKAAAPSAAPADGGHPAVLAHNFAGAVKNSVPLGETDGHPTVLDGSGRFLAFATSVGRLLVYDVSRVEPRQLAAGRFEEPSTGASLGTVTRLRINNDGSRIALLSTLALPAAPAAAAPAAAGSSGAAASSGASTARASATGVAASAPAGAVAAAAAGAVLGAASASAGASAAAAAHGSGADEARVPDTRVHVYSVDSDKLTALDMGPRRYPVFLAWEPSEHRQIAVQTERLRGVTEASRGSTGLGGGDGGDGKGEGKEGEEDVGSGFKPPAGASGSDTNEEPDTEVATLFCTNNERGEALIQQDAQALEAPQAELLGIATPYLHLLLRPEAVPAGGSRVALRSLRDFAEMEDADEATRRALLDFSFHMASGNMDEAYRAVKAVSSTGPGGGGGGGGTHIWENMAALCVKSKRMDVAAVCLGHMNHARGAKAVRELAKEPELEANVAQVAIQLGLLSDAARLYQACGRYDLLNKLYQDSGQWDRALAVAAKHDRLRLKATHFAFGKYLESVGDIMGAIKQYEQSGAARAEITRMLHDNRDFRALEAYCTSSADPETWKWYGQYLEARGDAAGARAQYQRAKDMLSLVRLACSAGDYRGAADLCIETGDRAGAFHLARALEAAGSPRDALIFYEKSGRYNHAVRLAKASGTDAELLTLALAAERGVQMDVARHFEDRGHVDRAVQLYRKGGALGRAIDLCFAHGLFEDLRAIAEEMGPDTNPELLRRCADFFISKGQFDKAVSLLITGRRYAEAADMCVAHKIEITEAMAEAMTPPKPGGEDSATLGGAGAAGAGDSEATLAAAREARNGVLVKIAKALKRQGAFHLATKKYTQAGEKVKAIKSLLRSGDTEKIIFFANKTRSPEVYTLAANYLQTLSWHTDAEILVAITEFYGKAKAHEQLSSFYEACAAVEIDEYRNYEKALAALKEALKAAARIKGDIREARTSSLTGRIAIVERFVAARKLAKTDMPAMAEACRGLLELRDAETAIRVGDVYALLVYYHAQQKQWGVAFDLVEDMRGRGILLEPFIESAVLREIYTGAGVDPVKAGVLPPEEEGTGGDEVGEELESSSPSAGAGGKRR